MPLPDQEIAELERLAALEPQVEARRRELARALLRAGRRVEAEAQLRAAVADLPNAVGCWLDLATLLNAARRVAEAEAALDGGLAANPGERRLLEAKALVLRLSGDTGRTEAFLQGLAAHHPDEAWIHFHLGDLVATYDSRRGEAHLRRAVELDPSHADAVFALMQCLERAVGPEEGAQLDEAFGLAARAPVLGLAGAARTKLVRDILGRVCAFDALDALPSFEAQGRLYAEAGLHTALFRQLAQARTPQQREALMAQHRLWGAAAEARAQAAPIRRPAPRRPGGRIRLGIMSSDLRRHPVGYFALPLFDHLDRDRFDVFAYSYYPGAPDPIQQSIADRIAGFRNWPGVSARDAAQRIADDDLDLLLELGGSTHMNRLEVMAWRCAPLQASWLGYPHSTGLSTIDRFICDPFNRPTDPRFLMETPLEMPASWIALGQAIFTDEPAVGPPPFERNGYVTFGTANATLKYSREGLQAWARIVAATPGSKFAFIRPEAASAAFRQHVAAEFARCGVEADRLVWRAVRGVHLPVYNEVDITLDTFPLTGGTTTTESLWMGVPLVTLRGEMFHERLSYSILSNAGLGDLCTDDLDEYQRLALQLAADTDRRRALRTGLRDMIRNSALGQTEQFARDFYDMLYRAVTESPAASA
ncbi:MAG: hypothetical protein JF588_01170 [Caulobacterales bacterium]|nr:hypothetical protein [Caulobacterales bacterium]